VWGLDKIGVGDTIPIASATLNEALSQWGAPGSTMASPKRPNIRMPLAPSLLCRAGTSPSFALRSLPLADANCKLQLFDTPVTQ